MPLTYQKGGFRGNYPLQRGGPQPDALRREVLGWMSTFISELRGPQEISSKVTLSGGPNAKSLHWAVIRSELEEQTQPPFPTRPPF